jgi:hypothetical protein
LAADGSPALLETAISITDPPIEIATTVANVTSHARKSEEVALDLATEAHVLKDDSKSAIHITSGTDPVDVVESSVAPGLESKPEPSIVEPEVLSPRTDPDSSKEGNSATAGDVLTSNETLSIPTVPPNIEEAVSLVMQFSAVPNNDIADVHVQSVLDNSLGATTSDIAQLEVLTSQAPREGPSAISAEGEKLEETTPGAARGSVVPNNEPDVQVAKDASAYLEVTASSITEPEVLASKTDAPKEDILPAITVFENPIVDVSRTASVPTNDTAEKYPQPVTDIILEASISANADPKAISTPDALAEDNSATSGEVAKLEETVSDVMKSSSLPDNDIASPQPQLAKGAGVKATTSDIVEPEVMASQTRADLSTVGILEITSEATALEEAISNVAQTSALPNDSDIAQAHSQPSIETGASNIPESEVLTPQAKLESSDDASVITSAVTRLDETIFELTPTSPPYDTTEPHPQPVMDTVDNFIKSGGADDDSPAVHVLATEEVRFAVREQNSCNVFIADKFARCRG